MPERAGRFASQPACDCVAAIGADLRRRDLNTQIVTDLLSGAVSIETMKIDSRRRGKPVRAIASYCPFCGVRYRERDDGLGAPAQVGAS